MPRDARRRARRAQSRPREADRPDVVVADFRLRGDDNGIATVRSVRALYPELPAILLSGDTAPDRLREAEDAGIALLHKPVAVARARAGDRGRGEPLATSRP